MTSLRQRYLSRVAIDWRHIVLFLCFLVMLPLVAYNVFGWFQLLIFKGEANFGEGILMAEARRLARGENIYSPITKSPYWVATYPPLYQLLIAPLGWTGFWWQRTISFLATCGQLSIFVLIARKITGSTLVGLVACAIWINNPCVNSWAVIGRTDTLGRFLQSACVASALLFTSNRRALWWAVAFGTLAMLTKQNMFACGIVASFILWQRRGWMGVQFALSWVAITTLIYGLIELATHGGFFQHILGYTSRGVDFTITRGWVVDFFWAIHWPYIIPAILGSVAAALRKDSRWLLVAVVAGVPNMIMTGNNGADRNYFFDVLWPISILCPLGIWHFGGWTSRGYPWWKMGFGILAALFTLVYLSRGTREGFTLFKMPYPGHKERRRARRLIADLAELRKPLLCELSGYQLLVGDEPDYAPYIMERVHADNKWDPKPIIDKLTAKTYGGVLLTKYERARFPEAILQAVRANYHLARTYESNYLIEESMAYKLYVPNP